ncbi:MAG: hypothetical protein WCI51_01015 [Lentisphaerota bacterium]
MNTEAEKKRIEFAVKTFAYNMQEKMYCKADEGRRGWDDPALRQGIRELLTFKTAQLIAGDNKQAIDVANLAMILDYTSDLPDEATAGHGSEVKEKTMSIRLKGWGWPGLSKKAHYYNNNARSLCGKWIYTGVLEEGNDNSSDNCCDCKKRLAKYKSQPERSRS